MIAPFSCFLLPLTPPLEGFLCIVAFSGGLLFPFLFRFWVSSSWSFNTLSLFWELWPFSPDVFWADLCFHIHLAPLRLMSVLPHIYFFQLNDACPIPRSVTNTPFSSFLRLIRSEYSEKKPFVGAFFLPTGNFPATTSSSSPALPKGSSFCLYFWPLIHTPFWLFERRYRFRPGSASHFF